MKEIHVVVSGIVQGVGFRYWTMEIALKLGLTGWVRNRADGTVEILAQGSKAWLTALLEKIQVGPPGAMVKDTRVEWKNVTHSFSQFEIQI